MARLLAGLASALPLAAASSPVTIFRQGHVGPMPDACAQCTLEQEYAAMWKKSLPGVKDGQCKDVNYTVPAGSKNVTIPAVGTVEFQLFAKDHPMATMLLEPSAAVTMYKVSDGPITVECGQFVLDKKFEAAAIQWLQMKTGECSDAGYTEPKGNKSLDLPVIGQVNVTLYKKADPLAFLKQEGKEVLGSVLSQALGLPSAKQPICCRSCKDGFSKFTDVDAAEKRCSEMCMNPEAALLAQFLLRNLSSADSAPCADMGYGMYAETVTKAPRLDADVYKLGAPPAEQPEGWVVIHRTAGVECFEATAQKKYADAALVVGGFKEGGCADAGFGEKQEMQIPPVLTGDMGLTLYKKPGELSAVDAIQFSRNAMSEKKSSNGDPAQLAQMNVVNFLV
jgi:hypothetical protein